MAKHRRRLAGVARHDPLERGDHRRLEGDDVHLAVTVDERLPSRIVVALSCSMGMYSPVLRSNSTMSGSTLTAWPLSATKGAAVSMARRMVLE